MFGFAGKILIVDLTRKRSEIIEKDEAFYRKYFGGALLCARLYEELTASGKPADPFTPENPVIFATGPLAGGKVCGSTRVNVMSLAPEPTGIYLSQAGGEFGPALKRAGFDALAVTGASDTPLIVIVENDLVRFEPAGDYWGMDRVAAFDRLRSERGKDFSIASIGPAGENRVRHANLMFEPEHYAGRGGLGAILGSKQVKAIAVRGDRTIAFHDPDTIGRINRKGGQAFSESLAKSPGSFLGVLRRLGTFGLLDLNRQSGNLPTRNFNYGTIRTDETPSWFSHETASSDFVGQINPCRNCFLACKKRAKGDPGLTGLAEYESVATLGPNLGLENDIATCIAACEKCNRLGLDTISTGNLIAWLMDCFEHGALEEKTAGFSIRFGEGEKVLDLIEQIALRRGPAGALLADGIPAAVEKLGPQTAPYLRFVQGIGIPAHLPHKKPGVGFAYLHGPNIGDHMKLEHDWIASSKAGLGLFGLSVRSAPEALDAAKIDVLKATQIYYAAMDSLSVCLFVFGPDNIFSFDDIIEMVNAATGLNLDFSDLMEIGERTVQLQRALYLRMGGSDADFLPFLAEAIPEGPSKGARIDPDDFARARKHYYEIMGWDEQGRPLPKTLQRLGI